MDVDIISRFVPEMPQALFESRKPILENIIASLSENPFAVISGMEGTGKSTFAAALFHAVKEGRVEGVRKTGYFHYTENMKLTFFNQLSVIPSSSDYPGYIHAAERYFSIAGSDMLIILDGVDIEPVVFPETAAYFAKNKTRVVFISRSSDKSIPLFWLDKPEIGEAAELFLKQSGWTESPARLQDAQELAGRLDCHPLLLTLAAGYSSFFELPPDVVSAKIASIPKAEILARIQSLLSIMVTDREQEFIDRCSLLSSSPIPDFVMTQLFPADESASLTTLEKKLIVRTQKTLPENASQKIWLINPSVSTALRTRALAKQSGFAAFYANAALNLKASDGEIPGREGLLPHALSISRWMLNKSTQKPYLLCHIAELFDLLGEYATASDFFEKAISAAGKSLAPKHPHIATIYAGYAKSLKDSGDYTHALEIYKKAMDLCRDMYGENHILYANLAAQAADIYLFLSDWETALTLYTHAYHTFHEAFPNSVREAQLRCCLASLFDKTGRSLEASELMKNLIAEHKTVLRADSALESEVYCLMARATQNCGEFELAYYYAVRASEIAGEDAKPAASAHSALALHYMHFEEYARAIEECRVALSYAYKAYVLHHPEMSPYYLNMANALQAGDFVEKAGNYYKQYLQVMEQATGRYSAVEAYKNISEVYRILGNKASCISYADMAVNRALNRYGHNHPLTAGACNDLALTHMYFGDYAKAITIFEKALSGFEFLFGKNDSACASVYNNIALAWQSSGEIAKAILYYLKALEIKIEKLGKRDKSTLSTYFNIYSAYKASGDDANARHYLDEYLENGGKPDSYA